MQLPEIKITQKEGSRATFEISPLMPGYGPTIGNSLRRVLLSSMEGAAVTSIKIKGVNHEFSNIPGVLEDVIQIILNVKKLRFRIFSQEPVRVTIEAKGEREVTGKEIKLTSDVELINPDQSIATITDKKTELSMELVIEKGVGYTPVEQRQKEKLPIGVIAVDAIFSPIRLVNSMVENVRVGQRIDYNKVIIDIETDGSVEPETVLKKSAEILIEQFTTIAGGIETKEGTKEPKPAKTRKKKKDE